MFEYNVLSDLLNGELVTPLKKDGDNIICLKNGEEVSIPFDEFDFDKTPEGRNITPIPDPIPTPNPEEYNFDTNNEYWLDKADAVQVAVSAGYTPTRNIQCIKEFTIEY